MRHPSTLPRRERLKMAAEMRKQASAWPEQLALLPESEWPPLSSLVGRVSESPLAWWRSRYFLAQVFAQRPFNGVEARRLSVNRVTVEKSGHYQENITWDELQRCKRETGHGDWYGLEIYPRDRDLVHVANMRHIWLLAEPLKLGWFS
jgi:hypothetical protein